MKTKEDCIFCKIIKGEIPSKKIYEDEKVIAILDINPVTEGHTLVIPKEHYEDIYDIPAEILSNVTIVTKELATKYKYILGNEGTSLLQSNGKDAGQEVFHFHMHLIPRYSGIRSGIGLRREKKPEKGIDEIFETIANGIHGAHGT